MERESVKACTRFFELRDQVPAPEHDGEASKIVQKTPQKGGKIKIGRF